MRGEVNIFDREYCKIAFYMFAIKNFYESLDIIKIIDRNKQGAHQGAQDFGMS